MYQIYFRYLIWQTSSDIVLQLCGYDVKLEDIFESTSNVMRIDFHSDFSFNKQGFLAMYTAVSPGSSRSSVHQREKQVL